MHNNNKIYPDTKPKMIDKIELQQKFEQLSQQEQKLKEFLEAGKKREEELEERLHRLKVLVQQKMDANKKETQSKIGMIFEKITEKTGAIKKTYQERIKKTIEEKNEKLLKQNKTILEDQVNKAINMINKALLDGNMPTSYTDNLRYIVMKAKDQLNNHKETEKEISSTLQEITKEIGILTKKYPSLNEVKEIEIKKGIFEKRKDKIEFKKSKKAIEGLINHIHKVINENMGTLDTDGISGFLEYMNETRDRLADKDITTKEIHTRYANIEKSFNNLKDMYNIKETTTTKSKIEKTETEKKIERKKEKLYNLIYSANRVLNKAMLDSSFNQGGIISRIRSDAEIIREHSIQESEIDKISKQLEQECKKLAEKMDMGTLSEEGKLIGKKLPKENKKTKGKEGSGIDYQELMMMKNEIEKLGQALEIIHNDNKKTEEELENIQKQKKNLEDNL